MAIRNIVTSEDPILSKPCRTVEKFDEKLAQLIDDMFETLEKAKGMPCPFNNWAVFYGGSFRTVNQLDPAALERILRQDGPAGA